MVTMMMRRMLAFCVIVGFLLAGCGREAPKEKIFFLVHTGQNLYGSMLREEFDKIAKEHGQAVDYFDAGGDADVQAEQLERIVQNGAKFAVLLAVDENKVVPAVEKAVDAGVNVVAAQRHLASDKVFGVYSDEYGAGQMQAEYMERNLPTGAHVFYLQGSSELLSSRQRWEGFKDRCLAKRPDIWIVDRQDGRYSREEGRRITEQWLHDYSQIDAIICANDEMALGALAALTSAHRARGCMVSGIDAMEDAVSAVEAGEMRQTIKQDVRGQAQGVYRMIEQLQQGEQPKEILYIPLIPITKDNVAKYRK